MAFSLFNYRQLTVLIISQLVKTSAIFKPLAGMTSLYKNINMQNTEAICLFHSWDRPLKLVLEQYIRIPLDSVRKSLHFIFCFIKTLHLYNCAVTEEFLMAFCFLASCLLWVELCTEKRMLHAVILTRLMYVCNRLLSVFILDVWIC